MAVTTPRETWTDPRIDDLSKRVDAGFEKVAAEFAKADKKMEAGFKQADERMDAGFEQVDKRFGEVDKRFEQVDKRFDKTDADIRELRRDMKAGFDRLLWGLLCAAGSIIGLLIKAHGL
jgi:hypothetical protein